MNRILPLAGVALALAVVACANPGKDKPKAVVSPAEPAAVKAPEAPAPAEKSTVFTFDQSDSKIEWVGAKVTLKHDGGFKTFAGDVLLTGGLETARFNVAIDTDSIWSDNEKLTGHLKSPDFFDVAQYPKATFHSTAVAKSAEGDTYDITGTLEMIGNRKQITFPATLSVEGDVFKADAEFSINRKDFGMVYPGMPDDLIHELVLIKLSVVAKKQ
jgi:polyisoprenoid-binding protein YceI